MRGRSVAVFSMTDAPEHTRICGTSVPGVLRVWRELIARQRAFVRRGAASGRCELSLHGLGGVVLDLILVLDDLTVDLIGKQVDGGV